MAKTDVRLGSEQFRYYLSADPATPLASNRQYESSYATAHNDWLQSLAETGLVGTSLLVLTLVVPLVSFTRHSSRHPLVVYPLLGLTIVLLYALFEFPFSSGAFLITFWVLFFTAIRKVELSLDTPHPHHE